MSEQHCDVGPSRCAECWWSLQGRGGEKPLSQCIEGLLRPTAEPWKVKWLADRARVLEKVLTIKSKEQA